VPEDWERQLELWQSAGLIDPVTAERIREYESAQEHVAGFHWPVLLALAFGALLLGAGIMLFVSAHWDTLSPLYRLLLALFMVAVFHVGGAFMSTRSSGMAIALHTAGTIALGAGIALTGQIFHLDVHWPSGIMLWALGAAIAAGVLRHWTQAAITAILLPLWLCGEWAFAMDDIGVSYSAPAEAGLFLAALAYMSARREGDDSPLRWALVWIGALGFAPAAISLCWGARVEPGWQYQAIGWTTALLVPLAFSVLLRGRDAIWNFAAAAWAIALYAINRGGGEHLLNYAWCAIGALILIAWGLYENRAERINFGIACFAFTVCAFYFSNVMDKLGRSASLVGLGVLFLAGGWLLEQTRRKLIARVKPEAV
jgi:uncharacterized membrane protein